MNTLLSKFLAPSTALMNRLKLTWKFSLIFALYLIPIVYVVYISLTEHTRAIDQVELEQQGLEYMQQLRPLLVNIAQTRGMTNAYMNGKNELLPKINDKRAEVARLINRLLKVDQQLGKVLSTGSVAHTIQTDWDSIVRDALSLKPTQAFAAHTALIEKVLALNTLVMENSRLLLDPSLNSNFMANVLGVRIPVLSENMGKARGLGAGIISRGSFTPETYLTLTRFIQNIENANNAMMHGLDVVFTNNPEAKQRLSSLRTMAGKATEDFVATSKKEVLQAETISMDAKDYFNMGTAAIAANLKLYDEVMKVLTSVLEQREADLQNTIVRNISLSLLLLLAALYIFAGFYRSMMTSINRIKDAVHVMAEGDLTAKVELEAKDEMLLIATDMNMMIEKINALVSQVISATNQVVISADQSGAAAEDARDGVNQQNAELEQIATAMNEMSATVHEVANNASSTAEATRNADKQANNGRSVVNQTVESINTLATEMQQASAVIKQLEADSESIGSVLDVIRGIAEQTNLLALNAAIEAARAGEQGRGFAVVADEVRTLASRTQDSTEEIQNMIEKLQSGSRNAVKVMEEGTQQTVKTVEQAAEAGSALQSITDAVDYITQMNEQIASAAEEQSSVAEEINRNVVNVRDIAEHTAENTNQSAQSSVALKGVAAQLQSLVAEFKVN